MYPVTFFQSTNKYLITFSISHHRHHTGSFQQRGGRQGQFIFLLRGSVLLFSPAPAAGRRRGAGTALRFLVQSLRMRVDHLGEFLDNIIEGVVVPTSGIVLSNLLVQGSQPEERHDVSIRVLNGDVQGLLVLLVSQMMIGTMF